MMKPGDLVKHRLRGDLGLVINKHRHTEADGNPNGDFTISYQYKVLFNTELIMIRNTHSLEVVNECR